MQHRYVGDIGDYVKFGLLRKLSVGKRIGVAWYLYPDETHNKDGRHTQYLNSAEKWRGRDPVLFQALKTIVDNQQRSVASVEYAGLLCNATYSDEVLRHDSKDSSTRPSWRAAWFERVEAQLGECDIVFADPDNGLCSDERSFASRQSHWKRLPLSEALRLSKKRTGIFYHHNSRYPGGHRQEISYWLKLLPSDSVALYWGGKGSFSPRTFFIVNPMQGMHEALREFCEIWGPQAQLCEK